MESSAIATTLYVLVPPSPLFAAHWSFFVPNAPPAGVEDNSHKEASEGRRIHVSGDRLNGFALEIIREYDIRKHRGIGERRFAVGKLQIQINQGEGERRHNSSSDLKDEDEGGGFVDNYPTDEFEQICVSVQPPGPSLNRVSDGLAPQQKQGVRDCQWWVRRVIEEAANSGVLHPCVGESGAKDVEDVIAKIPKN